MKNLVRVAMGLLIFSVLLPMESATAQSTPRLILIGSELYTGSDGNQYLSYNLAIENWNDFPNELFNPAPDLPPCGLNTNAARTWVDIYDASNDKYIYGFCGLSSSVHLTRIWFGIDPDLTPPVGVYVVLEDRRTNTRYRSNIISTNPIPTPELSVTVSAAPDTVLQGKTSQVTVHVSTTGGIPVYGATAKVSVTRGSIYPISGNTDDYGNLNLIYTATTAGASTITVGASKPYYLSGSGADSITVNLPSVNSSTGKGIVYFDTTAGTFQDLVAIKEEDWPNGACGYKLDYGLFSFNITNIPEGESVTMTLTFPRDLDSNTEYLKFGKNKTNNAPHWYLINSTLNGKNLTFKLTDGGSGDDDLIANGRIKDDGGPVTLAGDLNGNGIPADAGDLVLMKRASIGEIQADPGYDLNKNGMNADAGDLVLMKRASIGEIILS